MLIPRHSRAVTESIFALAGLSYFKGGDGEYVSCESLTRVFTFSCQVRSKSSVNFVRLSLVFANTTCFQEKGESSMTYVQEWVLLVVRSYKRYRCLNSPRSRGLGMLASVYL